MSQTGGLSRRRIDQMGSWKPEVGSVEPAVPLTSNFWLLTSDLIRASTFHSARNACTGSSRDARQAGTTPAASATSDSTTSAATNTDGSYPRI